MYLIKRAALFACALSLLAASGFAATKRIIVMTQSSNGTEITVSGVKWFPITTGARPQTFGSAWVASGTSTGASTAENTAIQNGAIYEEAFSRNFPVGTSAATIEATLIQAWIDRNAEINGNGANIYYGVWYDGASWSQS
jgi:hypothetical protein